MEQVAQEYAGEALVVKLDVADVPQAQARYEVGTLPQFLFFRQGKLVARAKGLPERVVVLRHALRNALIPVVTVLGPLLAALL